MKDNWKKTAVHRDFCYQIGHFQRLWNYFITEIRIIRGFAFLGKLGLCYLIISGITKFKYERKRKRTLKWFRSANDLLASQPIYKQIEPIIVDVSVVSRPTEVVEGLCGKLTRVSLAKLITTCVASFEPYLGWSYQPSSGLQMLVNLW